MMLLLTSSRSTQKKRKGRGSRTCQSANGMNELNRHWHWRPSSFGRLVFRVDLGCHPTPTILRLKQTHKTLFYGMEFWPAISKTSSGSSAQKGQKKSKATSREAGNWTNYPVVDHGGLTAATLAKTGDCFQWEFAQSQKNCKNSSGSCITLSSCTYRRLQLLEFAMQAKRPKSFLIRDPKVSRTLALVYTNELSKELVNVQNCYLCS